MRSVTESFVEGRDLIKKKAGAGKHPPPRFGRRLVPVEV